MFARLGKLLDSIRAPMHKSQDVTYRHVRQWASFMMLVAVFVCLLCAIPLALLGAWSHFFGVLAWGALAVGLIWLTRLPSPPPLFLRVLLVFMLVLPFWMQYTFGGLKDGNFMAALVVLILPMYTLAIEDRQTDALWVGIYGAGLALCLWMETFLPDSVPLLWLALFYGALFLLGWGLSYLTSRLFYGSRSSLEHAQSLIEELTQTQENLEQASKAKTDFLANMSHEIRTPMHAISGMADMLLLSSQLGPAEHTQVENIKMASQNLLGLINDVLDISKIEANRLELFEERYDFPTLLQDVVSIISVRARERHLNFFTQLDPDIPKELVGDSGRIRQVLLNLLGNAVKFTEKGQVLLSVQRVYHQDQLQLRFEVIDTGVGIHPGDVARLYGLFEQLDTTRSHHREGTGLGLAISRRLVELMGSELKMQSEYGHGTSFSFTIAQQIVSDEPIAFVTGAREKSLLVATDNDLFAQNVIDMAARLKIKAVRGLPGQNGQYTHLILDLSSEESYAWVRLPTPAGCQRILLMDPATPLTAFIRMNDRVVFHPMHIITLASLLSDNYVGQVASPTRQLRECIFQTRDVRILVVDDNEVSLMVAANLLKLYGINVDEALGGVQALRMLETQRYDIIFVDHIMPGMDGLETVRAIRKKGGHLQDQVVIALSANVMPESRRTFLAAGVTDSLTKPIELPKLSRMLHQYLPPEKVLAAEAAPESNEYQDKQLALLKRVLAPLNLERVNKTLETGSLEQMEHLLSQLQRAQQLLTEIIAELENALAYPSRRAQIGPALRQARILLNRLGANKLLTQAKLLDRAIQGGEERFISAQLATFVAALSHLLVELSEALGQLQLPPPEVDFHHLLEQLHDALLVYDYDEALSLVEKVSTFAAGGTGDSPGAALRAALDAFSYDEALSVTEQLLAEHAPMEEPPAIGGGKEYAS